MFMKRKTSGANFYKSTTIHYIILITIAILIIFKINTKMDHTQLQHECIHYK